MLTESVALNLQNTLGNMACSEQLWKSFQGHKSVDASNNNKMKKLIYF